MFDMRFQDTRRRARTVSLRSGYPVDRTMRPQEAVWDSGERCSRVAAQRPGPEGDPADNPFWDEDDFSAGERMPHKSTFFYPKAPAGIVISQASTEPL